MRWLIEHCDLYDLRAVQLGHADISTTTIYTYVARERRGTATAYSIPANECAYDSGWFDRTCTACPAHF